MTQRLKVPTALPDQTEKLVHDVIGCCIAVHRELGPGFAEKVYVRAIELELNAAGIPFQRERRFGVRYRGQIVGVVRLDLIVADALVLEVKSVEQLAPVHHKQIVNYMRVAGLRVGLLLNFNVSVLPDGLSRKVL